MMDKKTTGQQGITQESLQPQRIKPEEKAYQSVRDIIERLKKGDATNIALTGPYGSGKSSILLSLKVDHPEYKYLNISLATLQSLDKKEKDEQYDPQKQEDQDKIDNPEGVVTKENLDRLIEYSILQQLIYREKQETLPNSRLKRIFHLPLAMVRGICITTLMALVALVVVFEPEFLRVAWLCNLLGYKWLNVVGDSVCIIYLVIYAYLALMRIVPALSNSKLNKLNIKSGEIEIVKNTSIFNKHLDEILYFFEMTDYNVVILEDLDRFESPAIFLKLRELNLLLNESKVMGRKIFFIYAVRDDMFQDAERVKCFDYITTVIPVINPSNAKDQLKEELKKRGVTEIKDVVLRELGFFLRDMRLLKNITNEYVQYRGRLEKGISCEKLLAMIVYKNYYPKDFADLHDCKGKVYGLVNMKETFVSEMIKKLEDENERRRELVLNHQKERHLKETELRRIYVDAYRDKLPNTIQNIKAGDSFYDFKDVAKNEKLFEKFISTSNIEYHYLTQGSYSMKSQLNSINIAFSEIEKDVNPDISYRERLDAIRAVFNMVERDNNIEIKKEDVRSQSLSRIMNGIDYVELPEYKKLEIPRLIEYLVTKGYIDEDYYDYISYFYDNFIDSNDWNFVLDLKLGKAHPYDFAVHNVEACLQEISGSVYRKTSILNVDIMDHIGERQTDRMNAARLQVMLRTIVDNKKYDFLISYYQNGCQQDVVFGALFNQYKELWSEFEQYDDERCNLRLIWFKYAESELCCEGSRDWLSQHYDFITEHQLDINDEEWCSLIKNNNYLFKELNNKSCDVLKVIAERNAYVLSKQNVEIIVSCLLNTTCDSVSYSMVLQTEHPELIKRIDSELGTCLKTIFSLPEKKRETEETIIRLLKAEKVTEVDKVDYLEKQKNAINVESLDTTELKTLAYKCDVIEPTWDNVIYYMNNVAGKQTDEVVTTYIERHADELSKQKVPPGIENDERMLFRQLIKTDVLSFGTYKKILEQFSRWKLAEVPSIEERRILLLIENNVIRFKDEITTGLLNNYSAQTVVSYLMKNKQDFLKSPEKVQYTTDVALGAMRAGLNVRERSILIPHFDKSIINESLANEVISTLTNQKIKLDTELLLKVMTLSNMTEEKISVLNYTLEKNAYTEGVITSFLKTLPEPYFHMAEKGKKPEIPYDEHTKKLVDILAKQKYISSVTETKNGIRVHTRLK